MDDVQNMWLSKEWEWMVNKVILIREQEPLEKKKREREFEQLVTKDKDQTMYVPFTYKNNMYF